MSEKKVEKKAVKTVKITENKLVDLIDNIVNEAVAQKKTEWIAENATKNTLLEGRVAKLESFLSKATITKKAN